MLWLFLLLFFTSCDTHEESPYLLQKIEGRDRKLLLQAEAPKNWTCHPPPLDLDLQDTTRPIMEWGIDREVRITLHTFPIHDKRIPPIAQIQRWQKQLTPLKEHSVSPQAFAGFVGLLFEGDNGTTKFLAWTMQLADPHLYSLADRPQMLQDFTLKAQGTPQAIHRNRIAILTFARSLELIEEI
jgi:hypothetical protein